MEIYKFFEQESKEYSIDRSYKKGDIVIYGGQEYVCLVDYPSPKVPLFSKDWDGFKP